jgi:glycosyltransferase involved in cell wall biosynthesis
MPAWLHVNAGYWPLVGGAETYVQALSERFARAGEAVIVATSNAECLEALWDPRGATVAPGVQTHNGVTVVRSRVAHLPPTPYAFHALRRLAGMWDGREFGVPLLNRIGHFMPWLPGFGRFLEEHGSGARLVHAVNVSLEGPLIQAYRFARRRKLPLVITPFVHVGNHRFVERYYTLPHHLRMLRDSEAVIVQTALEAEALARRGVAPERLHQIGMGVDLAALQGGRAERFRERHGLTGPIVTFIGAVTYDKGAIHLTQAMARLWEKGHPARLALAGRSIAAGGYDRFFARLPARWQARVLRLGQVTGEAKQDLLAATDVLAMPSRVDAFGIAFLEAWAYSAPVIGARAGGIPGVIEHDVDGLLVPFGEVEQLAASIESLLADPVWARAMGARGRAKVEARYTWDKVYQAVRAIYLSLAAS